MRSADSSFDTRRMPSGECGDGVAVEFVCNVAELAVAEFEGSICFFFPQRIVE
jgi:hypothetical protein